ncbi:MAG TPA: CAP domain-containing protein [Solirubrobacterales bacterium]|nr:CAP domain-containing protein [Solirubrobacterales bacterium]
MLLSLSLQVTQGRAATCPGENDDAAPAWAQERAMRCLVDAARRRAGLPPLAASRKLARSAGLKSRDILRCDDFDHEACGREFTYWIERVGYRGEACGAGENIALGTGAFAQPRSVFRAWLHSPGHRRNILGDYDDLGVGLRIGTLGARGGVHVWTQHFGSRC